MKSDLLKYIRKINSKPSAQRRLLEQFVSNGASTIPEMSNGIGVSLPTATTALNDLIKAGLVLQHSHKPVGFPLCRMEDLR